VIACSSRRMMYRVMRTYKKYVQAAFPACTYIRCILLLNIPFSNIKEWRSTRHFHTCHPVIETKQIRILPQSNPKGIVIYIFSDLIEGLLSLGKVNLFCLGLE
jgi:hypothetical protein